MPMIISIVGREEEPMPEYLASICYVRHRLNLSTPAPLP